MNKQDTYEDNYSEEFSPHRIRVGKGDIDKEGLLAQARLEIEKAEEAFREAEERIQRAMAIQWLLDQTGGYPETGLLAAINEMLDDLYRYQKRLDDPGEGSYDEMMQCYFLEKVQILLCTESVDEYWNKVRRDRENRKQNEGN